MQKIQKNLQWLVTHRPKTVLFIIILLSAVISPQLLKLYKNPSPYLLSKEHHSRVNMEKLRDTYTGANITYIMLLETKDTVFKPSTLKRIQELTEAFEEIQLVYPEDITAMKNIARKYFSGKIKTEFLDFLSSELEEDAWEELEELITSTKDAGQWNPVVEKEVQLLQVRLSPIKKVISLGNTDNILGVEGGLDINPVYEDIPESKEEFEELREQVKGNELFHNFLYAENGKVTGILLELFISDEDTTSLDRLYKKTLEILEEIPGEEKHYVAGFPVVATTLRKTIDIDSTLLSPIVLIIVGIFLFLTFGSASGIIVPILVVLFSLGYTLALMGYFEIPIDTVTSALPVFLIAIGVANGIHIFSGYRDNLMKGLKKVDAVKKTIDHLFMPVVMTSITTAVGFTALASTEIIPIRNFGLFVAIGTIVAMVFALVFIPSFLMVLPSINLTKKQKKQGAGKIDKALLIVLKKATELVLNHSKTILFVAGCIAALALYGLTMVKVESNSIKFFKPSKALVISNDTINEKAAGTSDFNIIISAKGDQPFKKPENLKVIDKLQTFLKNEPIVGKTNSLTDLLKRINYVLHENDPAYNVIPEETEENSGFSGKEIISQYLLLYENGGGDVLSDVVNSTYNRVNLRINFKSNSSSEVSDILKKINNYIRINFPQTLKVEYAGMGYIDVKMAEEIVTGQMKGFFASIVVVSILLMIIFRSFYQGLLGMVPLVLTLMINFGLMGFFKVNLDMGTALVSSIVIGIGADFSIHYMSSLMREIRDGLSYSKAMMKTIEHSGKAITSNALTVGLAFTTLLFADFVPMITMGWMITLTLIITAFSTLVILPAMLVALKPAFLFPKTGKESTRIFLRESFESQGLDN